MRVALLAGLAILMFSATTGLYNGYMGADAAAVDAERHFRAALTLAPASTVQMVQSAQELEYWIRIQTGPDITYFDGTEACTECDPAQESLFFVAPRLYVDGARFWLNHVSEDLEINLRPLNETPQVQYELIVSPILPKTALNADDITAINGILSQFGLLGSPVTLDALEIFVPTTKNAPPEEARIDSVLFNLIAQPDWIDYATLNQIGLSGFRARVLVELAAPSAQLPEELDLVIESQSENFARVQVMIHRLTELATHSAVGFVRLPSTPQPPGQ